MSTTKLWATASKEWVIPSKPKPGRKPKKDVATEDTGEDDAKGRRIQNRAAQRAFRERKQSQLAELQARILSYEQGEIERNVALQKIAKRLKEENDKLLLENASLKERVAKLEQEQKERQNIVVSDSNEKKRWRDESPPQNRPQRKRTRVSMTPPFTDASTHSSPGSTMVSTPDETQMPPVTFDIPPEMEQTSLPDEMLDFSSSLKVVNIDPTSFPQFDCGFCSDETPCVCRELALHQLSEDNATQELLDSFKQTVYPPSTLQPEAPVQQLPPKPGPSSSILENLPAYQPPVPLRRKSSKGGNSQPIFPVFVPTSEPGPSTSAAPATCSGDPSNCSACNDDDFGKAFCSAIEETVNASVACDNCPSRSLDGPLQYASTGNGCCGNLMACGGCPSTSASAATTVIQYEPEAPQEYIPTNDAWRRIKEHPNVQFADLALLAEVVASRSKCTGPRIVITPPPDHLNNIQQQADGTSGFDPVTRIKQEAPRLVPQEILLECGRRRVREVHSEAVRDALRLLDAKFT